MSSLNSSPSEARKLTPMGWALLWNTFSDVWAWNVPTWWLENASSFSSNFGVVGERYFYNGEMSNGVHCKLWGAALYPALLFYCTSSGDTLVRVLPPANPCVHQNSLPALLPPQLLNSSLFSLPFLENTNLAETGGPSMRLGISTMSVRTQF